MPMESGFALFFNFTRQLRFAAADHAVAVRRVDRLRSAQLWKTAIALLAFLMSSLAKAQTVAPSDVEVQARALALLQQMNVEEKVGQLNQVSGLVMKDLFPEKPDAAIASGRVGSILWQIDPNEINRLQHLAVEKTRLHIPLLVGLDVIHGYRTVFPVPLAMASSWDPEVEEQAQRVAAEDARAAGINWTFAPMVDIARDARWGRIVEGAGEDPYLGATMARAQVKGFQGQTIGPESLLACAKHFAGYGAAEGGRDYDSAYIPEELFRNVYLAPFYAAIRAGSGSLMSAYMDLNDVPATGNRWLLHDILRDEWGFKGFVVSDAVAASDLRTHGFARDREDAGLRAFTAGVNMDMASRTFAGNLPRLVNEGKISESDLDSAVLPLLETKIRLGLFEHPYVDALNVDAVLNRTSSRALERKLAARSMVLLKNDSGLLPLSRSIKNVALVGPLADSPIDILGGWSVETGFGAWGAPKSHVVTVAEGLKNALSGARFEVVSGPPLRKMIPGFFDLLMHTVRTPEPTEEEKASWVTKAVEAARRADLVIAVMGESANMSSEAASRATLVLPGIQDRMLEAVAATGKPIVLVLLNGRPLAISWASEHVPAILEAWYPGSEGGNAIADILFGAVNPGGKLPVSWPRTAGQEPLYYNHNLTHVPENSPQFGSRYWDLDSKPLYPFGYGLSYSTFKFNNLRLDKDMVSADGTVQVSVDVTNTSKTPGDEVAELYIHQRAGSASRPVRELKGFRRVALAPGEMETLTFTLGKDELQFWSPQAKAWVVEPGIFDIWAGGDSTATLHTQLEVVAGSLATR
jgi:beta-glucosidase